MSSTTIPTDDRTPLTCTILSGRSFIGKSLVSTLLKSKHSNWIIRIADTDQSLILDVREKRDLGLVNAVEEGRVVYFQVDVREKAQLRRAITGSSVVFHLDGTVFSSNDFYLQYLITVQGTKNVISVCQECEVKRLIYNSSADVVFDGLHDIINGDESFPYPRKFEDVLVDLKAQAEALVLFANSERGLLTSALRPSIPFGPDDTLVPLFLSKAKSSLAKFIIGNGKNICDFTYVGNVAHAHVCTEVALRSRETSSGGQAFFITNLEPMKFWEFVAIILEGLGYQSPNIHLPAIVVSSFLLVAKFFDENWGTGLNFRSHLNPATVQTFSRTRTFNCLKAESHIGYSPVVSLEEGITLAMESFSYLAEDSPYTKYCDINEPSKADRFLGSGTVAEVLLWRDEKKTFTYFLAMIIMCHWFLYSERTFISSTAKLLLLILVVLFVHGILPSSLFGFTINKLSRTHFQVSFPSMNHILTSAASLWNRLIQTLQVFAQAGDSNIFFKVATILYFSKILFSLPFSLVVGSGIIFAFTAFFTYEQHERKLDHLIEISLNGVKKLKGLLIKPSLVPVLSFLQ